ncbi:MAG TPA: choice-of-anchor D domain-containing protein [Planctomycetota bacterium]|nr:choice-of-anchor D domain-containing protein [Planctomycetota bacterium]
MTACGGGGGGGAPLPAIQQQASFGVVRSDGPTQIDVAIPNPLSADASAEDLGGAGGPFAPALGALPAAVAEGADLTLRVVFTPPGPGAQAGEIHVRFVAGKQEREVVLELAATVETPSITLLTPELPFPLTFVGQKSTLNIRVRNPNQATQISLTSISALPDDFSTSFQPRGIDAGQSATIGVTYDPQAADSFDFEIEIGNDVGAPLRVHVTAQAEVQIQEVVTEYGTVPVTGGETGWLDIDVPDDAISVSIESVAPSITTVVGLLGFEGPGGKVYENDSFTGEFLWTQGFDGVFAATLPQNDSPTLQLVPGGGTYRFRLFVWSGSTSTLDVRAIVERRPNAGDSKIDLNIFIAPGLGITGPQTNAKMQAVLSRVDDIFGQIGLGVGEVAYYQLGNSAYNDVTDSEFPLLLAESSAASDARMNVFFVQTALGGGTLGVAAALPGPKRNSTRVSGVMVDYDWSDAGAVGQVTAHEIGHYLGLYHTAESDGQTWDIIGDTLECPGECTTASGGYLMHWQYFSASMPTITAGEAHVILGHPLVDPAPTLASLSAFRSTSPAWPQFVALPAGFCANCNKPHK